MTELDVFKQSLDVSRLTLMVSLFVSTASIVFASLEMAFQRSHNKRSVKPLCELSAKVEGERSVIVLRNVGLGPLILSGLSLSGEGAQESSGLVALLELPEEGLVIPSLEKREILSFPEEGREEAEGLVLKIRYRDIYDRKHETGTRLGSVSVPASA
jgi:hypothetical protein